MADLKDQLASLRIDRKAVPRRRYGWPLLLLALPGIGGAGYYAWRNYHTADVLEVEIIRPFVMRPGEAPRRMPVLTASGYVVARKKAVVSAKIQGRLSELRVEEGTRVKEGDILARLESADQEAQVERAKAAVERAEVELAENQRQLKNSESLAKDGIAMQDDTDQARSRVRINEAALKLAKADLGVFRAYLDNTVIKAPFSGIVIKKMAEVGESVAPIPPGVNVSTSSGAIVAMADFATLEVEVDVNESNISKLRDQHPAEISIDAIPERRFKAMLRQIIPSADRTKATVLVKVSFLEKDDLLRPELSARVTFFDEDATLALPPDPGASPTPVITVPRQALTKRAGGDVVFESARGKAVVRKVVLGEVKGDRAIVKDGIGGTEQLILNPAETLQEGQEIKTRP